MEVISPKNENEKVQKNQFKFKPYTLLVRKLSENYCKSAIKSEIANYFNSPDKFFDLNSHICLNKKINLKKIIPFEDSTLKERTSNKRESTKSMRNNTKKFSSFKDKNIFNSLNVNREINTIRKNFETIDNEKLKNIFKSFKNKKFNINQRNINILNKEKKDQNFKSLSDYKIKKNLIPRQLSSNLMVQNRILNIKRQLDKQNTNISKYLSKKLRKNESDLLFNGVHLFKYKKEILDNDENYKDSPKKITENSCLFKWISSLRRPKNFYGKRENYINVSSDTNPLWSIVIEKYPITKEISVKAGYNLNNRDFNYFKRNRNLSSINSAKLKNVEDLDSMSLKGENLYDVEYNREMSSNNSKILHKVFVDNGKVISYNDVNNLFGNETIYRNYNYHSLENSLGSRSLDNMNVVYSNNNTINK